MRTIVAMPTRVPDEEWSDAVRVLRERRAALAATPEGPAA